MGNTTYKRRQYFINKRFQIRFIIKFTLVFVLGAVLSVLITMYTTQGTLTSSFEGAKLVIEKTSFAIMPSVIITNIITTTIVGVIALVVTLLVSHKIAGPMFRFEKDLEDIAAGNLRKKIHIRNGDQFASVAGNLNGMVNDLHTKISEVQEELHLLSKAASEHDLPKAFIDDLETCRKNIDIKFKL